MYLIRDTYGFISSQGPQTDNRINNLLHQFPFSLPYGGNVARTSGGWSSRSTGGYFWSEGANSGSFARRLAFYGAGVGPESNDYKTYGFPVRCVASQVNTRTNSNPNYITLTLVLKNFGLPGHSNRQPHQQPSPPVSFLATVWRARRSHYRRLARS